jgi:hypothetical protein
MSADATEIGVMQRKSVSHLFTLENDVTLRQESLGREEEM